MGGLLTVGVYGIATLGFLLFAAAAALAVILPQPKRHVGALIPAGGAIALTVFGAAQLPYMPCTEESLSKIEVVSDADYVNFECGGVDPLTYFGPAGVLLAAGAVAFALGGGFSRRSGR